MMGSPAMLAVLFLGLSCVVINAQQINSAFCRQLRPRHTSAQPQKDPPPFNVVLSTTQYTQGQTMQVKLQATEMRMLRGFIIQARRADWRLNQNEPIGHFVEKTGTETTCETQLGNALTDSKQATGTAPGAREITLSWTAPTPSEGHIQFWVTYVNSETTYWLAEKSEIVYDPNGETMPKDPSPKPDDVGPMSSATIDTAGCGKSKGCYRDPPNCEESECTVLVTWKDQKSSVSFELSADTEGWVGVGFSKDNLVGDDSFVECVWDKEKSHVEVNQAYLTHENEHIEAIEPPDLGLSNAEGFYSNGRVKCRFDRVKVMRGKPELYDLNDEYHIILVRGKVTPDGSKEMFSPEPFKDPWITPGYVSLSEKKDITGRARYPLVKAHGCLMIIAWMMLATTGILLSRYYKPMWPNDRICAERVWFAMHRMLMLICCACTLLAFILIFIHRGGYSYMRDLPPKAHPPIGITITILIVIIAFMVLCRCNPKDKERPCYNWFHWLFTTAALVLSTPNMFIGLSLPQVHCPWWATWVLVSFMLFHIVIELLLEIHGCINARKQKQRSAEYELMRKNEPHRDEGYEPEPVGTRFKTIILTIYLLVMIILGLIMVITVAIS